MKVRAGAAAVALALLAGYCAYMSWGPFGNLFGYRDSPAWVYVLFGACWLLPALGLLALAVGIVREAALDVGDD